ncbi:GtrA family protein [Enterococcus bulliens]
MNVLLALQDQEWQLETFPIETIYEDNNEQTHFRPIKDSILVYFPFLRFLLSSLTSSFVDIGFFMLLSLVLGKAGEMIFLATLVARITAGMCNYYLNKHFVFSDDAPIKKSSWKYIVLFIAQLVISGVSVSALSTIFSSLLIIKLVVDLSLFFFSFQIQKYFIFNHHS